MLDLLPYYLLILAPAVILYYFDQKIPHEYIAERNTILLGLDFYILTLIFNFIYTGYFGWNWEPVNETEVLLDRVSNTMVILSVIIYALGKIAYYKVLSKKDEIKR